MIPLTYLEYELSESADKVLERLKWAVDETENSWMHSWSDWYNTPMSQKPWVGEIDRERLQFFFEEPAHLFNRTFNVVLKGKIDQRAATTNIHIKIGLDLYSSLWLVFSFLLGGYLLINALLDHQFSALTGLPVFLVLYSVFGAFLIRRRMKRSEEKLEQLFG